MMDPIHLPIYTSSYCNLCEAFVTPYEALSEETWKMSLGKFIEIALYNNSARCRTGECSHSIRDSHVLSFFCHTHEGRFQARMRFQPMHPFALSIRKMLPFERHFHNSEAMKYIKSFIHESEIICSDFRRVLSVLERQVEEVDDQEIKIQNQKSTNNDELKKSRIKKLIIQYF